MNTEEFYKKWFTHIWGWNTKKLIMQDLDQLSKMKWHKKNYAEMIELCNKALKLNKRG